MAVSDETNPPIVALRRLVPIEKYIVTGFANGGEVSSRREESFDQFLVYNLFVAAWRELDDINGQQKAAAIMITIASALKKKKKKKTGTEPPGNANSNN